MTKGIKLEAGKFYRDRAGRKIGPLWKRTDPDSRGQWQAPRDNLPRFPFWFDGGFYWPPGHGFSDSDMSQYDLVEVWNDEAKVSP